jgi:flagellar protein FliS
LSFAWRPSTKKYLQRQAGKALKSRGGRPKKEASQLCNTGSKTMNALATAFEPARTRNAIASNFYRQTGVQTGLEAASPHRLVAMLFDGLGDAIAQAQGAIATGQVELKGRTIGRAVRIVDEGLKGALDMQQGGSLAADLSELYSYVIRRLTEANLHSDAAALEECKRVIAPLREAWDAIAPQAAAAGR